MAWPLLPAGLAAAGKTAWNVANIAAAGYGIYEGLFGNNSNPGVPIIFPDEIKVEAPEYKSPTKKQLEDIADQQWRSQLLSDYWNRDRLATSFARGQLDRFAFRADEESKERWVDQGYNFAEAHFPTLNEAVSPASLRQHEIELTGRKELI